MTYFQITWDKLNPDNAPTLCYKIRTLLQLRSSEECTPHLGMAMEICHRNYDVIHGKCHIGTHATTKTNEVSCLE